LELINDFKVDFVNFREDSLKNGPLVDEVHFNEAVERLNRFKEEFKIRKNKMDSYRGGEELFALPLTDYPEVHQTKQGVEVG
jgi:dynein heavy chain